MNANYSDTLSAWTGNAGSATQALVDAEPAHVSGSLCRPIEAPEREQAADSNSRFLHVVEQGAVLLDGRRINLGQKISPTEPAVLKVGKRRFKKLIPAG